MKIENLQKYYNEINKCSIVFNGVVDFEFIQTQISKIAVYTEELNRIIGEILIDTTKLEHSITDTKFEYELKFTDILKNNIEVQKLSTVKERTNYINYFILQGDYKNITNLDQELRDNKSLLDLAKKKARDLDRTYPKLRTLWESIQAEVKFIKKIGSDEEHLNKVLHSIDNDQKQIKPIFTDNLVEQIKTNQYNDKEDTGLGDSIKNNSSDEKTSTNEEVDSKIDDLLQDL